MDLTDEVLREQSRWRQLHTFGGFLWPDPERSERIARAEEPPMSMKECLDEVEWLLDGGMAVHLALEQIPGRTPEGMYRAASRHGRHELARRIGRASEEGRHWPTSAQKRRKAA